MTMIAFVPARSGSKRLPNKNIKDLNGKPLFIWTLEACMECDKIDQVIFSTDSTQYWEIAQSYFPGDKLVLDDRSEEEAGDKVKIFDYLKNNVDKIFSGTVGSFILTLPTMPLRNESHVSQAIDLYNKIEKPVFSAVEYDFAVSFAFTMNNTNWEPLFPESPMITGNTRSQDQVNTYHPNGAIYIRNITSLKDPNLATLYQGGAPIIMDRSESVDIDTKLDFEIAKVLMQAKNETH